MNPGRLFLAGLVMAASLGCERLGGGKMPRGSVWDVFKGGKKVFVIKNAPGAVVTVGVLPAPGKEPPAHPFITAVALDLAESSRLHEVLERSRSFQDVVAELRGSGYTLHPSGTRI